MRVRLLDAAELVFIAALSAWIGAPIFSNLADRLTASLDSSRVTPHLRGAVLAALFAAAGMIFAVARRRRSRQSSALPTAAGETAPGSDTDVMSMLAYGGFGLLFGALLSGDLTPLGQLAGARLAEAYPRVATIAGIALVITAIALLYRQGERSTADAAAGLLDDPWIARSRLISNAAATIVGFAFALGVALLFIQLIVWSWIRTFPWSALVAAAFFAYVLWETLRDVRTRPRPVAAILKEIWQGLAIVAAICSTATVIFDVNYRGFTESSAVFRNMTPATRVAFFAMPIVFLGVLVVGLARFAYSGHRVRVFISFHHSREDTALQLERSLVERGLVVGRLPFRPDYEHDRLLQRIQHEIRSCTAMVCLPGAQPSFIENEVLVASTLRKFILFVVGEEDPRLPNTAYYGYPVFRLERLTRQGFDPIAQLILLVAGNWKASVRHFLDGWTRHLSNGRLLAWLVVAFVAGTYSAGAAFALITADGAEAVHFLQTFHRAYFGLLGAWMILWIWFNAFLIGSVFAMVGQIRARRVLRQDILTGHLTRDLLRRRIGGGKRALRLLACMREKPPPAEHEM